MGDVFSGIGNAIGSAVDGLESVGSDVLSVGGKLLSNPAVDTAIGSMVGCPELGMIAPIISGLTGQGGSASPTSLGQAPGMFGGGDPFGGIFNGGLDLNSIFGGMPNFGGEPPISGFPGGFGGLGGFGGGTGMGIDTGLPSAGGFNPSQGLGQLLGSDQSQFQFQKQVTAISVSDEQIRARIKSDVKALNQIWCPHTATAAEVYWHLPKEKQASQWVLVATAHPAKFNDIVEPLIGREVPVPPALAKLLSLPRQETEIEPQLTALRAQLQGAQ